MKESTLYNLNRNWPRPQLHR